VLNRDKKRAAGLGIIRVEVFRARDMGQTTAPAGNPKHNDMSIAEKALKGRAISHGTGFSDRTFLPVQEWVRADNLDKNPYVIFQFKYRSKGTSFNLVGGSGRKSDTNLDMQRIFGTR
jgi:hypothetical protein